jgi:hypothetical protein
LIHDTIGVAGDYFEAMGIPLREGRFLKPDDARAEELLCVVDDDFARHYWQQGGAVGKLVYRGTPPFNDNKPYRVVGVVGAVKQAGLTDSRPRGAIYIPYSGIFYRKYFLVARTGQAPEALGNTLVKAIREIDPEMPLTDLRSMEVRIDDSLSIRRSPALMAGIFAASALLLATI